MAEKDSFSSQEAVVLELGAQEFFFCEAGIVYKERLLASWFAICFVYITANALPSFVEDNCVWKN